MHVRTTLFELLCIRCRIYFAMSGLGQIGARGRGAALSMHPRHLKDGFHASALPGVVTPHTLVPCTVRVTALQASGGTTEVESSEDLVVALNSKITLCRTMQAEVKVSTGDSVEWSKNSHVLVMPSKT